MTHLSSAWILLTILIIKNCSSKGNVYLINTKDQGMKRGRFYLAETNNSRTDHKLVPNKDFSTGESEINEDLNDYKEISSIDAVNFFANMSIEESELNDNLNFFAGNIIPNTSMEESEFHDYMNDNTVLPLQESDKDDVLSALSEDEMTDFNNLTKAEKDKFFRKMQVSFAGDKKAMVKAARDGKLMNLLKSHQECPFCGFAFWVIRLAVVAVRAATTVARVASSATRLIRPLIKPIVRMGKEANRVATKAWKYRDLIGEAALKAAKKAIKKCLKKMLKKNLKDMELEDCTLKAKTCITMLNIEVEFGGCEEMNDSYNDVCDCAYHPGGCRISDPAPPGRACYCSYKGFWTCGGSTTGCKHPSYPNCDNPTSDYTSCLQGGGDCDGY